MTAGKGNNLTAASLSSSVLPDKCWNGDYSHFLLNPIQFMSLTIMPLEATQFQLTASFKNNKNDVVYVTCDLCYCVLEVTSAG
jgi:hypothetical protein